MTRPIAQVPLTASAGAVLKACAELILEHGPHCPTGVCLNLAIEMSLYMKSSGVSGAEASMLSRAVTDLFNALSRLWPHFSGDPYFPVPCPDRSLDPKEAYAVQNKWEGEYGDLRRNLLEFVRDHATGVLEESRCEGKITEHPVSTIILNSYGETPNE